MNLSPVPLARAIGRALLAAVAPRATLTYRTQVGREHFDGFFTTDYEIELVVSYVWHPAVAGRHDASAEIIEARDPDGREVNLTKREEVRIMLGIESKHEQEAAEARR